MGNLPERDNVTDAMVILHIASWEFGKSLDSLAHKVRNPDDHFPSVWLLQDIEEGNPPWKA